MHTIVLMAGTTESRSRRRKKSKTAGECELFKGERDVLEEMICKGKFHEIAARK